MASGDWDILVWRRADDLRRQAERIQRNFSRWRSPTRYRVHQGRNSRWEPPVNVVETAKQSLGHLRVPGVTAKNVKVELDGNELVISGKTTRCQIVATTVNSRFGRYRSGNSSGA